MAVKYPQLLWIGLIAVGAAFVLFHLIRRKNRYDGGKKVANTRFVRSLPQYKRNKIIRTALAVGMEGALALSLIMSMILIARPYRTESVTAGVKKRDIYLCMDVSYSICDLNYELVDSLKDVVKGLDGDRFGISMFNTSTVLYVPMTDDYDFVLQKLDELHEYFGWQKEYQERWGDAEYYSDIPDDEMEDFEAMRNKLDYFEAGTLVRNLERGSSLIGEGLATCLYSFPGLEESDRTRCIIFSTDNAQENHGKPIVELEEAAQFCGKKDVTVFGIFPNKEQFDADASTDYEADLDQMEKAVEGTGGAFYKQSESLTVGDIVDSIRQKEAMEVQEITTVREIDQPVIPAVILLLSLAAFFAAGLVLTK
ncbi:MAG: hypothetical protein UHN88_08890 [Eubacterium sp.]|nr:hypothetical protein [Eubacterium sp.]